MCYIIRVPCLPFSLVTPTIQSRDEDLKSPRGVEPERRRQDPHGFIVDADRAFYSPSLSFIRATHKVAAKSLARILATGEGLPLGKSATTCLLECAVDPKAAQAPPRFFP